MKKPVCAIVGVGPGNGAALARRFHAGGYAVALLGRTREKLERAASGLTDARTFVCDATVPEEIISAFGDVREAMGAVSVLCYNAGGGGWENPEDTTVQAAEDSLRTNAVGLLIAAQQVIPDMIGQARGSLLITGATASLRGGAGTTAFAAGKAAQRSVAQSLARHLGPKGVHVALFIVDGVVDLPRTRDRLPDKTDDFFLQPDDVAESMFQVAHQRPSAWTFEMDLRPFGEKW